VVEFEMDSERNGSKAMSEKQRSYIERLLFDRNIDEGYRQMIKNVLQDGLSSLQASKIIDFLKSCIEFKRSFAESVISNDYGSIAGKSGLNDLQKDNDNLRGNKGLMNK